MSFWKSFVALCRKFLYWERGHCFVLGEAVSAFPACHSEGQGPPQAQLPMRDFYS